MIVFEKLKKKKEEEEFFKWLDTILKDDLLPEIKAINFNLYEDMDNKWSIELVGTSMFDENDDDWACCEVFSARDNIFVIEQDSEWKEIEILFIEMVKKYLNTSKYSHKLKQYEAVGIGFVDGDMHILYRR
ncbi:MAG: hypothetical protein ACOX1F_01580 [Erysipelotrichaceae bacterium]|jgi:hypothetical protein